MTACHKTVLESLREEYRIKRHILVFQGENGAPTITFGIFRPIILCGKPLESREAELLLRHEMVHIKRWDILWKILIQFAIFLHWWNPFMWALFLDFERVSEWACDEAVMQGRSKEEVDEYLLLLIEEAHDSEKSKKSKKPRLRFRAGFGNNAKKKLKKRMENLMKRRKWNKVAAGVLVTVLAFANSITVFAYRDPFQRVMTEDVSQEEIEYKLDEDMVLFALDDINEGDSKEFVLMEEMDETEILYDNQFVDEEGNIYPITEPVQRGCSHDFVSGTTVGHHPNSDGSCEVRKYNAQRCTKCGLVVEGSLISTTKYVKCPH